jgi:hypothetical protein
MEVLGAAGPRILKGDPHRMCRKNAIVYLAQKKHSSYGRDSYGMLLKSLDLVHKNYLSLGNHANNTDLIIFHTADFNNTDLILLESYFGTEFLRLVYLVDVSNTSYWRRPYWHEHDDPATQWALYPTFSEGYRRMMHFFAIDVWRFLLHYGKEKGCMYEYIMRLDEDSYLHSPIEYDVFDYMKQHDFYYGFRMCAYEMQVAENVWSMWRGKKNSPEPFRDFDPNMCGFYNNLFVAKLSFFQSSPVRKFLRFINKSGAIYRLRLGDLAIQSMTVYAFAPPEKIHRFLDFTYEHGTIEKKSGCLGWGGIQAGFNDPNAEKTLESYYQENVVRVANRCRRKTRDYVVTEDSLSPTYAHLPVDRAENLTLRTIMGGDVEITSKGILSG